MSISGWSDWEFGPFIPRYKETSASCWSFTACYWLTQVMLDSVYVSTMIVLLTLVAKSSEFSSLLSSIKSIIGVSYLDDSSCCSESQREAALLIGQFATTDSDCKVFNLVLSHFFLLFSLWINLL